MLDKELLKAVRKGDIDQVKFLLATGASIDAVDLIDGNTCLHIAARNGHLQLLKLLLEKQASLFITNYDNEKPILGLALQNLRCDAKTTKILDRYCINKLYLTQSGLLGPGLGEAKY